MRTTLRGAVASAFLLAAVIAGKAFFGSKVEENAVRASPPCESPASPASPRRHRLPPLGVDPMRASPLPRRSVPEAPSGTDSRPAMTMDLEETLNILRRSATEGDPASPPVNQYPSPHRDWEPTPEELADPELYRQREEEFTQRVRGHIKDAFDERIENVRQAIEGAEAAGDRSPGELDEAYDALEMLTRYQNYLETGRDDPEHTSEQRLPPGE